MCVCVCACVRVCVRTRVLEERGLLHRHDRNANGQCAKMAASTEKVTIDDATENSVFTSFKRDENKLADLKYAITALNEGYNKMNVILTKIVDLNARSSVIFSEATCTTVPVEKYVVASIFQKGIDVLEHYVHSENKIKVPADVRQRNALCKLLCFLTEGEYSPYLH